MVRSGARAFALWRAARAVLPPRCWRQAGLSPFRRRRRTRPGRTLDIQGIGAGGGIVNNSANAPTFTLAFGGAINFNNSASAGNASINNVNLLFGVVNFNNNRT